MPETRALLADLDRISLLGSAAEQLVNTLPQTLATERQAGGAADGRARSETRRHRGDFR
jgi:hypothetical protein